MNRNWMYVFVAGLLEVVWVMGLKHSTTWWMWLGTAAMIFLSFTVFIRSLHALPVSTVYAVFTGLGTVGTVIVEMLFFNEPFRWLKVILILLLLAGVIGLKTITEEPDKTGGKA
ncbi:DMT family transporter [Paenibacillus sp. GCM10027628]|uniref:DMT family transporter n=1 Tax=Paenibacillus sp. GCM10027628 TaxID=3273413 RepID=UPI003630F8E9